MKTHIYFDNLPIIAQDGTSLPPLDAYINATYVSCPLPLLKLKFAQKQLNNKPNWVIYMMASDNNAVFDIDKFCQKNTLELSHWQSVDGDTITHLLITKNRSISPIFRVQ